MSEVKEKVKERKYSLTNYFKMRKEGQPDTMSEILNYMMQEKELPFEYDLKKPGNNLIYDVVTQRQKHGGGIRLGQYLTPPVVAEQIGELTQSFNTADNLVLNACCGAGMLVKPLMKEGFTVEGFDVDPEMVEICRKVYKKGNFYIADFTDWGENKKQWELIVANPPLDKNNNYKFFKWLREALTIYGRAILILEKGYMEKDHSKIVQSILQSFKVSYTTPLKEAPKTTLQCEIAIIEFSDYYRNILLKRQETENPLEQKEEKKQEVRQEVIPQVEKVIPEVEKEEKEKR